LTGRELLHVLCPKKRSGGRVAPLFVITHPVESILEDANPGGKIWEIGPVLILTHHFV